MFGAGSLCGLRDWLVKDDAGRARKEVSNNSCKVIHSDVFRCDDMD